MMADGNTFRRLRWMLDETFGAAGEFERRQAELAFIAGGRAVSEDELQPHSWTLIAGFMHGTSMRHPRMHSWKRASAWRAHLAPYRNGETSCLGYVPSTQPGGAPTRLDDVRDWVEALNGWYAEMLRDGLASPSGARRARCLSVR